MIRYLLKAIIGALAVWSLVASAGTVSREARVALTRILPEGYRTAAVVPLSRKADGRSFFVVAVVDRETAQPIKNVRLLYLAWNGRWTVLDTIEIAGRDVDVSPQYLNGISVVRIGSANLLYVYTNWSGGGSGSLHYFQFYTAVSGQLKLLRVFEHDRMERGLLCLRDNRIYDAEVLCSRGEKRGAAYVYSCYLNATEFTYDGKNIVAVRSERLGQRTGNRYLGEKYWNLSLCSVLRQGDHFLSESAGSRNPS